MKTHFDNFFRKLTLVGVLFISIPNSFGMNFRLSEQQVNTILHNKNHLFTAEVNPSNYKVYYRKVGTVAWTKKSSISLVKKLTGLLPATIYECKVRSEKMKHS